MKLKKGFGFIVMAVAMLGLSSTLSSVSHAETKVGFVYVGPIGDHGWTYQHDRARLAVEKALGNKVKTTFVESVKEGPDLSLIHI